MKNIILLIVFIILVSCKKYVVYEIENFDPDFHIGNSAMQAITNGHEQISCADFDFDNFACLHVDKVKELNRILNKYRRVPRQNQISKLLIDLGGSKDASTDIRDASTGGRR